MTTDPIADMLTRIRNSVRAKHSRVDLPSSLLKVEIARILKDEGYLANFKVVEEKGKKTLRLFLRYTSDRRSVITDLQRVSRPGSRRRAAMAASSWAANAPSTSAGAPCSSPPCRASSTSAASARP